MAHPQFGEYLASSSCTAFVPQLYRPAVCASCFQPVSRHFPGWQRQGNAWVSQSGASLSIRPQLGSAGAGGLPRGHRHRASSLDIDIAAGATAEARAKYEAALRAAQEGVALNLQDVGRLDLSQPEPAAEPESRARPGRLGRGTAEQDTTLDTSTCEPTAQPAPVAVAAASDAAPGDVDAPTLQPVALGASKHALHSPMTERLPSGHVARGQQPAAVASVAAIADAPAPLARTSTSAPMPEPETALPLASGAVVAMRAEISAVQAQPKPPGPQGDSEGPLPPAPAPAPASATEVPDADSVDSASTATLNDTDDDDDAGDQKTGPVPEPPQPAHTPRGLPSPVITEPAVPPQLSPFTFGTSLVLAPEVHDRLTASIPGTEDPTIIDITLLERVGSHVSVFPVSQLVPAWEDLSRSELMSLVPRFLVISPYTVALVAATSTPGIGLLQWERSLATLAIVQEGSPSEMMHSRWLSVCEDAGHSVHEMLAPLLAAGQTPPAPHVQGIAGGVPIFAQDSQASEAGCDGLSLVFVPESAGSGESCRLARWLADGARVTGRPPVQHERNAVRVWKQKQHKPGSWKSRGMSIASKVRKSITRRRSVSTSLASPSPEAGSPTEVPDARPRRATLASGAPAAGMASPPLGAAPPPGAGWRQRWLKFEDDRVSYFSALQAVDAATAMQMAEPTQRRASVGHDRRPSVERSGEKGSISVESWLELLPLPTPSPEAADGGSSPPGATRRGMVSEPSRVWSVRTAKSDHLFCAETGEAAQKTRLAMACAAATASMNKVDVLHLDLSHDGSPSIMPAIERALLFAHSKIVGQSLPAGGTWVNLPPEPPAAAASTGAWADLQPAQGLSSPPANIQRPEQWVQVLVAAGMSADVASVCVIQCMDAGNGRLPPAACAADVVRVGRSWLLAEGADEAAAALAMPLAGPQLASMPSRPPMAAADDELLDYSLQPKLWCFLNEQDQQVGPMSEDAMRYALYQGDLDDNSLVRCVTPPASALQLHSTAHLPGASEEQGCMWMPVHMLFPDGNRTAFRNDGVWVSAYCLAVEYQALVAATAELGLPQQEVTEIVRNMALDLTPPHVDHVLARMS